LEDLGVDGRKILDEILENRVEICRLDSYDPEQRQVLGSCEQGNELPGSTKSREFVD
jgi:hypothetical protein